MLLGNLTVFTPGDNEHIVDMERFDGMLTSIKCNPDGLELAFDDDESFAHAQKVWDWVNGADNHTFVMVAGKGDCGKDSLRTPYLIHTLKYDEGKNIARLQGKQGTWEEIAHTYELRVGRVPMSKDFKLLRRDLSQDLYMNLALDLKHRMKVQTGPVSGELICDPCNIGGRMKFELVLKTTASFPTGASLTLSPESVRAQASLRLTLASNFDTKVDLPGFTFPSVPLAGVSIKGILTVGPVLEVSLDGEAKLEGAITVTAGATASLENTAVLRADLLSPGNNQFSGWQPQLTTEPVNMEAKATLTFKAWLSPMLKVEASALGQGLEAGVSFRMPYVEVKAEAFTSQGGSACKPNDGFELGLRYFTQFGAEVRFRAGKIPGKGGSTNNVDLSLGVSSSPLLASLHRSH